MTKNRKLNWQMYFTAMGLAIGIFATILVLLLLFPVWPALTAGVSSISFLLFGIAIIVLMAACFTATNQPVRAWLIGGIAVALFGLVAPQLGYLRLAQANNIDLTFDPIRYAKFSGRTTIKPTKLLTYKNYDNQSMQIALYQNEQLGNHPVVILLHGGSWRFGNYLETGSWPQLFVMAGYSVASVEYRLANEHYASWRDAPADIHDAVSYLANNAGQLGINPHDMTLFGQSSGGHLALLEAYRNNSVTSVIALYAPVDLELDYKTSVDKSSEIQFLGGTPNDQPARYKQTSPLTYVSKNSPRTLLVQGTMDDIVSPRNAGQLSDALDYQNVQHDVLYIPLAGHSFDNQQGGFTTQLAQKRALQFIGR